MALVKLGRACPSKSASFTGLADPPSLAEGKMVLTFERYQMMLGVF